MQSSIADAKVVSNLVQHRSSDLVADRDSGVPDRVVRLRFAWYVPASG